MGGLHFAHIGRRGLGVGDTARIRGRTLAGIRAHFSGPRIPESHLRRSAAVNDGRPIPRGLIGTATAKGHPQNEGAAQPKRVPHSCRLLGPRRSSFSPFGERAPHPPVSVEKTALGGEAKASNAQLRNEKARPPWNLGVRRFRGPTKWVVSPSPTRTEPPRAGQDLTMPRSMRLCPVSSTES